ncbi:hypothetical protein BOW53_14275 [Solemya pervernicosa gill symbiont]|uniref:Cyclic nucleotide-binding domain-containing protein n=2 Tax=Gammaproteobacteria incertae sedis TaxID=118884 RepID=A0A1T2L0Y6_9GAMM|nr:cyclic nucleotide-binding domain-containing protein [Candidatus Reidiella endopervernicosa]OOZ38759.1 hypothetical protein BOW53_14275 [Solemya pervernicosa gill symbiont]QKQ26368.1 cyclic nucleotide-binding domain-containing protein [Candidatus Reidiella endopervernicosa]
MFEELEHSSCFQDLSADQIASIMPCCSIVALNDGEFLICEGEHIDRDFYLLLSGTVEIVSNDTNMISGEVVLSKEDKDLYGELALLTGCKRTASVRCRGDVDAIRINGEALMNILTKDAEIGFKVLHRIALILAQRLEQSDSLIKQLLWNTNI